MTTPLAGELAFVFIVSAIVSIFLFAILYRSSCEEKESCKPNLLCFANAFLNTSHTALVPPKAA
jgi:hypothetical protein